MKDIFNRTSKQLISIYSYNGEPIVVFDLGYMTIYEFNDCVLCVNATDVVTILKDGKQTEVNKNSIIHTSCMIMVERAQLLQQASLGMF